MGDRTRPLMALAPVTGILHDEKCIVNVIVSYNVFNCKTDAEFIAESYKLQCMNVLMLQKPSIC